MGDGQDFGRNERGGGNLTKKVFQICTRIKTFDVGGTVVPLAFFKYVAKIQHILKKKIILFRNVEKCIFIHN